MTSIRPAMAGNPITQERSSASVPRFGCRLFAEMSAGEPAKNDTGLQALVGRLFAEMSAGEPAKNDTGLQALVDSFFSQCRSPKDKNDDTCELSADITKDQEDGTGVSAYYPGEAGPTILKTAKAVDEDGKFRDEVKELLAKGPHTFLGHLRYGKEPEINNSHPFQAGQFSFMHNGTVPPFALRTIDEKIETEPDIKPPKGGTDTERTFRVLVNRLEEAHGADALAHPEKISNDELKDTFTGLINDIDRWEEAGQKTGEKPPKRYSKKLEIPGGKEAPFGLNFVLTDGDRLIASRYNNPLSIGILRGKDGEIRKSLIATRPPKEADSKIQWHSMPARSMVFMERQKNGQLEVEQTLLPPLKEEE